MEAFTGSASESSASNACDEELTAAQRATIRQLERERICSGRVVDVAEGCGWARVEDDDREVIAVIDRAGTLLKLEGQGRPRKSKFPLEQELERPSDPSNVEGRRASSQEMERLEVRSSHVQR